MVVSLVRECQTDIQLSIWFVKSCSQKLLLNLFLNYNLPTESLSQYIL